MTTAHINVGRIWVQVEDKQKFLDLLESRKLSMKDFFAAQVSAFVKTASDTTPLTIHDPMTFGKYQGVKVGVIIRMDPSYIKWALENVARFHLDSDAIDLWREMGLIENEMPIDGLG